MGGGKQRWKRSKRQEVRREAGVAKKKLAQGAAEVSRREQEAELAQAKLQQEREECERQRRTEAEVQQKAHILLVKQRQRETDTRVGSPKRKKHAVSTRQTTHAGKEEGAAQSRRAAQAQQRSQRMLVRQREESGSNKIRSPKSKKHAARTGQATQEEVGKGRVSGGQQGGSRGGGSEEDSRQATCAIYPCDESDNKSGRGACYLGCQVLPQYVPDLPNGPLLALSLHSTDYTGERAFYWADPRTAANQHSAKQPYRGV
jgi:hypothetical protein